MSVAAGIRRVGGWELAGVAAGALLLVSFVAFPWYGLEHTQIREAGNGFLCGGGQYSCTGLDTFPFLRYLTLICAVAPLGLLFVVATDTTFGWPPGEMTMVIGFAETLLLAYNGIIDMPGTGIAAAAIRLEYGYWIALGCAVMIGMAGLARSADEVGARQRKPPGTF